MTKSLSHLIQSGGAFVLPDPHIFDDDPTEQGAPERDEGPNGTPADRRHARVLHHLPVIVFGRARFCAGVVEDLSESGAFVQTRSPFPVDCRVQFALELPNATLLLHAVVRWRRLAGDTAAAGMGVQFTALTATDLAALRSFVASRG